MRRLTLVCSSLLLVGAVLPLHAQNRDGYLFREPVARFTLRGGYALASASSDVFDFAVDELTLRKRDFSSLALGAELAFSVTPRVSVSADVGYSSSTKGSEFRRFIDNSDRPIEQTTTFQRVPILANVRYYITAPGESIGKLAWIPSRVTPYVGAGAGAMWYRFKQDGDFIERATSKVFRSTFESSKWTPAVQGLAGLELSVRPGLAISTDVRYLYARGDLGRDFSGFNKIDLSGVSAAVGFTVRM